MYHTHNTAKDFNTLLETKSLMSTFMSSGSSSELMNVICKTNSKLNELSGMILRHHYTGKNKEILKYTDCIVNKYLRV